MHINLILEPMILYELYIIEFLYVVTFPVLPKHFSTLVRAVVEK